MTMEVLLKQLRRLAEVSPSEWWVALDELLKEIAFLLHGKLKENEKIMGGQYEYLARNIRCDVPVR